MSRLNLIVESLLKDIIEAQHAANCHAASLARQYGKRGRACGFPLPSAQIGSLEFDLKYAVTGTSGVEEKQVADTEQWSLFRQELEERVPSFAIRSIVMAVVHSSLPDDEARSDFSSLLAREEQWKKNFCSYLVKKISAAVSAHEGALLKAEPGWTGDCCWSFWQASRKGNSWIIRSWRTCSREPGETPSGRNAAPISGKAFPLSWPLWRKSKSSPGRKAVWWWMWK